MKNILILGGSYFVGRVYSILTCKGQSVRSDLYLNVVNRGRYPLNGLDNLSQYISDRHDLDTLRNLFPKDLYFDAVVDFCAYEPNDIKNILDIFHGQIGQYIYISTASVYASNSNSDIDENSPVINNFKTGTVDDYVCKKLLLENELINNCAEYRIPYTILRPSFIFGPFNYAPRESWFIKQICEEKSLPYPYDATGRFSFVYVMDVADIINHCISNEKAYYQKFNLACPEVQSYESFFNVLRQCGGDFKTHSVTISQVYSDNIPLPFPLDESLVYNGNKVSDLFGYTYTPFLDAMKKTYSVFKAMYQSDK